MSSSSDGFRPNERITSASSFEVMAPSPSTSNTENAFLISATSELDKLVAILFIIYFRIFYTCLTLLSPFSRLHYFTDYLILWDFYGRPKKEKYSPEYINL